MKQFISLYPQIMVLDGIDKSLWNRFGFQQINDLLSNSDWTNYNVCTVSCTFQDWYNSPQ